MKKNARMKVLYKDGNLNLGEAFTFEVELVRWWNPKGWIHYVLTSIYTTERIDGTITGMFYHLIGESASLWHEAIMKRRALNVNEDYDAIGEAKAEYDKLKAFVEGFKAAREVGDG